MVLKLSRGSLSQLDLDLVLSPNQVEAGASIHKIELPYSPCLPRQQLELPLDEFGCSSKHSPIHGKS